MDEIAGFDASRHQGELDQTALTYSADAFGFLKITDGIRYRYVDWFERNAPKVAAAGKVLGAYHFLLDHHPGQDQARYYVQQVERLYPGFAGVVPVVDIEREQDGTTPGIGVLRDFVSAFRELVPGRDILIYTGRWYWVGVLKNPRGADLGPLWHSEYDGLTPIDEDVANGPEGLPYGGWTSCLVWQHTSSGYTPGVAGRTDRNLFHGSRADLLALAGATIPAPPEEEDDMPAVSHARDPRDGSVWEVLNFSTRRWLAAPRQAEISVLYWDRMGVTVDTPGGSDWSPEDLDDKGIVPGTPVPPTTAVLVPTSEPGPGFVPPAVADAPAE